MSERWAVLTSRKPWVAGRLQMFGPWACEEDRDPVPRGGARPWLLEAGPWPLVLRAQLPTVIATISHSRIPLTWTRHPAVRIQEDFVEEEAFGLSPELKVWGL